MDTCLDEFKNPCTKVTAFLTFIKHVHRFDFFFSPNMGAIQITPKINPSLGFC